MWIANTLLEWFELKGKCQFLTPGLYPKLIIIPNAWLVYTCHKVNIMSQIADTKHLQFSPFNLSLSVKKMNNQNLKFFVNFVRHWHLMQVLRFPLKTQTLHSFTGLTSLDGARLSPICGFRPGRPSESHKCTLFDLFPLTIYLLFITSNSYVSMWWGVERGVHHMPTVASVLSG